MPRLDRGVSSGTSAFGTRVRSGELVIGMMVFDFFVPALPRVVARAGVDFAVFDMESTSLSFERFEMLAAVSHAVGLAPVIRLPEVSASSVGRSLDLGAVGVMAPKIRDAAHAREFAEAARFPPDGSRGSGHSALPDGHVSSSTVLEREQANAATVTICQLETASALDEVDEIVATPGIDVVNVGVNDLAAEWGVPSDDVRVSEAVGRVRRACVAHGKAFAARAPRRGAGALDDGHRVVLIDHDTAALSAHARAGVEALRKELAV